MNNLFDRKLLKQNRARSIQDFANHNFLYHEIAKEIIENLQFLPQFQQNSLNFGLEIGARDGFLSKQLIDRKICQKMLKMDIIDFAKINPNSIKNDQITTKNGVFESNLDILADDEFLPFKEKIFDLVISNLNIHHVNLMPQFLLQSHIMLKKNGVFMASFFGDENLPELHQTIFETEQQLYGGVSPRMIPTIDVKTAANLLQKAGFVNTVSNVEFIDLVYQNPLKLLQDLQKMGQGNILNARSRRFFSRRFLERLIYNYQQNHSLSNGSIKATFAIVVVSGFK